eukprot:CAMPEP_0204370984 /NCGR_PEP_ID=MMETSP0469-20131031/46161_1 /ASSEMBLY_ACC=CAM_ASM_000384 /TAXON_ID=2969 /ORGANISM="Oxyrrhis marina" /LENGTH=325 /DNA_ID=CAMNT_0051361009 /DNA_START=18 /DNA_END=995 /DNA_ORIENTATION=-
MALARRSPRLRSRGREEVVEKEPQARPTAKRLLKQLRESVWELEQNAEGQMKLEEHTQQNIEHIFSRIDGLNDAVKRITSAVGEQRNEIHSEHMLRFDELLRRVEAQEDRLQTMERDVRRVVREVELGVPDQQRAPVEVDTNDGGRMRRLEEEIDGLRRMLRDLSTKVGTVSATRTELDQLATERAQMAQRELEHQHALDSIKDALSNHRKAHENSLLEISTGMQRQQVQVAELDQQMRLLRSEFSQKIMSAQEQLIKTEEDVVAELVQQEQYLTRIMEWKKQMETTHVSLQKKMEFHELDTRRRFEEMSKMFSAFSELYAGQGR